jgi:hypothetical protein
MTQRRYSHYTYSITNKASIVLLCVLIVAGGSLFINALAPDPVTAETLLKRIAWPLWGVAFLFRLFQWVLRTVFPPRSQP